MSEDLFANPYSTIPDELWRAPSPRDRQLAAVEYWADLTGIQKTASKAEMIRRVRKTLASMTPEDEARITGGIMATLGAGGSLLATRKKPQDEELTVANGIRTKRPSAEQLDLRAERASLQERIARGDAGKYRAKLQDVKERLAQVQAENPLLSAAITGGLVGGGSYLGYRRYYK